ncbi:peptidylprolyl isomerase, partial [bacterium]|nr:peptidylprolyl isomerase [candidate division CSSED10-310 bacterium]
HMRSKWSALWIIGLVGLCLSMACGNNQTAVKEMTTSAAPAVSAHDDAAANSAQGDPSVVTEIAGQTITMSELNEKIKEIPPYARKNFLKAEGKEKILDNMIKSRLLYLAAMDAGYDKDPEIQAKVKDAVERIYQSEYFNRNIKEQVGVSDEDITRYYETHREDYRMDERIKVAHILVDTEPEAVTIAQKLKDGEDFDSLAKRFSLDLSSNNTGGVIGYITRDGYIRGIGKNEDFEQAAFALREAGDLSGPVQTKKGWHIIKLLEKTEEGYQPLEEVKSDIANQLLVTEEDVRKEYENNKDAYMTRARVKVSHIQLNTEKEAQDALERLRKGADFGTLARELSQDKSSSKKDGDIGYIYENGYIRGIGKDQAFEQAAFAAEEGTYTDPVKTKKGYHVILVVAKEAAGQKELTEVESQIRNKLLRDSKENAIERQFNDLWERYGVKIFKDHITDSKAEDFPQEEQEEGAMPFNMGN